MSFNEKWWSKFSDKYKNNKIYVLYVVEKYGHYILNALSPEKLQESALNLLTERFIKNWYAPSESHFEEIRKAVDNKDGKLAFLILLERSNRNYEYEFVSLEEIL